MPTELKELRGETYKIFDNGNGTHTYTAHCKPIHYKDDWVNGEFKDIDEKSFIEYPDYIYYDKLPYKLKIFKLKTGYEIESKRTGDKYKVELSTVDSKILDISKTTNDDLEFEYKINSSGVGLWKHLKTDKSPTTFKWKVTENAKSAFDTTKGALNFKYDTAAVEIVDIKEDVVQIATSKSVIDKNTFYWTETAPKTGISVDTDVTYYTSSADGRIVASGKATWSDARNATTGTAVDTTTSVFYQAGCSTNAYAVFRSFYYFDTSGLPDAAEISAASFSLYSYYGTSVGCCMKGTQGDTLTTADFDSFSGSEYGHKTWTNDDGQYNSIGLNAQGISDINLTGVTKICFRDYTYDYSNVEPDGSYYCGGYYSEQSSTTKDPKLSITYTSSTAHSITGQIDGVSITSLALGLRLKLIGAFTAISNIVTVLTAIRKVSGMVEVMSSITNAILVQRNLKATIDSVSAVSSILKAQYSAKAQLDATSNIDTNLRSIRVLKATSTAVSSLSAELSKSSTLNLQARIDAISNLSALLTGGTIIGTFHIINNGLLTIGGADTGTYQIINNEADISISGVAYPILPFHQPYFQGYENGILTLRLQLAA